MRARGVGPRSVSDRQRSIVGIARLAAVLVVVLVVTSCASVEQSPSPSTSAVASPSATASSGDTNGSPSASPSTVPTASPTDLPIASPTEAPTPSPTAGGPSSSPVGGTAICFGSDDTRSFFRAFAQDVSWPVYCAVLPTGWSVVDGTYHLANGGRLTIIYRRRSDDARITLDEGSVCAVTDPCVPAGDGLGSIPFGDRQGDFSGSPVGASEPAVNYAAVVDQTENPAWVLTGTGISAKDFKVIAAKLALLDL